jgi:hypothetical protein
MFSAVQYSCVCFCIRVQASYAESFWLGRSRQMSHVLVNGKWVCITQGTAPHPPEQSAEEVHNVKGRSLAQIKSRLFELTGTQYLKYVIHLQVNPFPVQSIEVEHDILTEGDNALELLCHQRDIPAKSTQVKRLHCVRRWSQRKQEAICCLCLPAAGMPHVSKCEFEPATFNPVISHGELQRCMLLKA